MFIQLNGQIISYEKIGEKGAPLIMLHGNGENHHIFDQVAKMLSETYTVYLLDTRGHGKSARPKEYHYRDFALDLINFIEAFQIMAPAIFGFSDGAITALMAAKMRPNLFYKIIIAGANLSPNGLTRKTLRTLKQEYRTTKDPLTLLMLEEPVIFPWELAKITCPVLVLAGSKDMVKKSEAKFIAKKLPDSTLNILKGESHSSYVLDPNKLYPLIQDFITDDYWKLPE